MAGSLLRNLNEVAITRKSYDLLHSPVVVTSVKFFNSNPDGIMLVAKNKSLICPVKRLYDYHYIGTDALLYRLTHGMIAGLCCGLAVCQESCTLVYYGSVLSPLPGGIDQQTMQEQA